ncbi:hypothetical protein [Gorillibacterium massiliense]|uniref:hypothetical protein n=1 Tax=Gorillibacterium massiliense TaxID=1280390 RepID=UPI0005946F06|nr:hypothetical protein [Gorillibacterium massiliense]
MEREARTHIDDALLQGWQEHLPETLNAADRAQVVRDGADPGKLRIHIDTEGRSGYTFDFAVKYLDDREIKVDFIDVDKDRINVDESPEPIQNLIEDYVRHIHECAQLIH